MARRLLLVALALTALVVVPMGAEAASAGFCAYGVCAGVLVAGPTGLLIVQVCNNLATGCNTQIVPHGQPVELPALVGCNAVLVPEVPGVPTGNSVVTYCA